MASATRASSLVMVLVTATGFAGGGGWMAGRARIAVPVNDSAAVVDSAAAAVHAHAGHRAHHAAEAAATTTAAHTHHGHDCEKGICRCDNRCPPRRSGPCGGAMRSCSGEREEAGLGPGPIRPFLLSAVALLAPGFDRFTPPDAPFTPLIRARDPVSPPPRPSSI